MKTNFFWYSKKSLKGTKFVLKFLHICLKESNFSRNYSEKNQKKKAKIDKNKNNN